MSPSGSNPGRRIARFERSENLDANGEAVSTIARLERSESLETNGERSDP
jgi:hypothetical protein